jgi:hypothetical protein
VRVPNELPIFTPKAQQIQEMMPYNREYKQTRNPRWSKRKRRKQASTRCTLGKKRHARNPPPRAYPTKAAMKT